MADRRHARPASPARSAPRVVSPRNNTNVALPFSVLAVREPKMTAGDWISLAGLVVSVAGFGIVIWRSTRPASQLDARAHDDGAVAGEVEVLGGVGGQP